MDKKRKTPDKKILYDVQYNRDKRKHIGINLTKETAQAWQESATSEGKNLTRYVIDAVNEHEARKSNKGTAEQPERTTAITYKPSSNE